MPKGEPRDRQETQTVQRTLDRRLDLVAETPSQTLWVVPRVSLVGQIVERTLEAPRVYSEDNLSQEHKEEPKTSLEADQTVERIVQVTKVPWEDNRLRMLWVVHSIRLGTRTVRRMFRISSN